MNLLLFFCSLAFASETWDPTSVVVPIPHSEKRVRFVLVDSEKDLLGVFSYATFVKGGLDPGLRWQTVQLDASASLTKEVRWDLKMRVSPFLWDHHAFDFVLPAILLQNRTDKDGVATDLRDFAVRIPDSSIGERGLESAFIDGLLAALEIHMSGTEAKGESKIYLVAGTAVQAKALVKHLSELASPPSRTTDIEGLFFGGSGDTSIRFAPPNILQNWQELVDVLGQGRIESSSPAETRAIALALAKLPMAKQRVMDRFIRRQRDLVLTATPNLDPVHKVLIALIKIRDRGACEDAADGDK